MELFRITHERWANSLVASPYGARWNSPGIGIIYAATSRSLACLENIVHRKQTEFNERYKSTVIYLPDKLKFEIVSLSDLPPQWNEASGHAYSICRSYGDGWAIHKSSVALLVPSAIIKNEYNILLNPGHNEFEYIKIVDIEPFFFDPRIKK
jgi:RES domain-containing protein